jgi:hypothetical protein
MIDKKRLRLVFAALFLFVLLAEWGSHGMHYAGSSSAADVVGEPSVFADGNAHDDPCKTLVVCGEGSRKDHKPANLTHNSSQHNGVIDHLSQIRTRIDVHNDPPIHPKEAHALFRPPDLPFHPPRLS